MRDRMRKVSSNVNRYTISLIFVVTAIITTVLIMIIIMREGTD